MMDQYQQLRPIFTTWNLTNKRVFLRADLNVPLNHHQIIDDSRLQAIRPTLDYLVKAGSMVTLATHIKESPPTNSDSPLVLIRQWLTQNGYTQNIIVHENLAFNPLEYHDRTPALAEQLAAGMDFYINDAFASCHRESASLTDMPHCFDRQHRSIGFLIEKEIAALSQIRYRAEKPFVMILGGNKFDKLPYLEGLYPLTTYILLCPLLCEPFIPILRPYLHTRATEELISLARKLVTKCRENRIVTMEIPQDLFVANTSSGDKPFYKPTDDLTPADHLISIGSETLAQWKPFIAKAKTIFFNGPMGYLDKPPTTGPLQELLEIIVQTPAFRCAGGGSTLAALKKFNVQHKFDVCSTGGGATLAYLSGSPLPALDALIR